MVIDRDKLFEQWWKRERIKWSTRAEDYKPLAKLAWDACFRITSKSSGIEYNQESFYKKGEQNEKDGKESSGF